MQRPMMGQPMGMNRMANEVNPENCMEYRKYRQMGDEICQALEQARSGGKQPAGAAPEENIIMREARRTFPRQAPGPVPPAAAPTRADSANTAVPPAPDSCPRGMNTAAAEMAQPHGRNLQGINNI